jgi:hypothetical protein
MALRMDGTQQSAQGFMDGDACLDGHRGAVLDAVTWLLLEEENQHRGQC